MLQHIETTLSTVEWNRPVGAIIAVAGTATTLAAMELGLKAWDRSKIHGTGLSQASLDQWMDRLLHATPTTRRQLAQVSPERADNLLAGAAVLSAICKASGRAQLTISDGGIRHGVLLT
jgi:exopolyphosphatase/guanosine-5'-triphosphate,3'-diphosphate pyrophosphatase